MAYILNRDNITAHDNENLQEKCNTDQIRLRRVVDIIPDNYRRCEHCMPKSINAQVEELGEELEEDLKVEP